MEHVYAALLVDAAGGEITEQTVTKTLEGVGARADPERVVAVTSAVRTIALPAVIETVAAEFPPDDGGAARVYATLLLEELGTEVTARKVGDTLETVGVDVDPERLDTAADSATEGRTADPKAVLRYSQTGQEFAVEPGDTVGRDSAEELRAAITIEDPQDGYIAAVQMQFERDGDAWYLIDRGLNGTFVQQGDGWQRLLCDAAKERLGELDEDYTDRHGEDPDAFTRLQDGDLIAPVDPTYGVTFEFQLT